MEEFPFGPIPGLPPVIDNFTYEDVKESHCVAQISEKVCKSLIETSYLEGKRFLTVCCPAYNEEDDEMLKTLVSLLKSFDYLKNTAPHTKEFSNPAIQEEFGNVIPLIVPIFDGTRALSASMREWLTENFPGCLDELEGKSEPGLVDVRTYCSKWYYYTGSDGVEGYHRANTPSLQSKISNNNKHTRLSSVVDGLLGKNTENQKLVEEQMTEDVESGSGSGVFPMTEISLNANDTGSVQEPEKKPTRSTQLEHQSKRFSARINQIYEHPTAQFDRNSNKRDSTLNAGNDDDILYFYMCPIIKKCNHRKHNSHQWFFDSICEGLDDKLTYAFLTDCGTSYQPQCLPNMLKELFLMDDLIGVTARQRVETPNRFFKPCEESPFYLLKGDHSVNKNACWKCWATFALTACPLQGFEFEASTVLNLALFNLVEALPVMPGPCQLMHWPKMKQYRVVDEYFNLLFEGENEKKLPQLPPGLKQMQLTTRGGGIQAMSDEPISRRSQKVRSVTAQNANATDLTFTEFLRVNMRLAEDRILSFVSVFSTGYGTKWVAGSTFYYQPEIQWTTLLTQRRRWINGTFAGFLFYFMSPRARARVTGGMFDMHKPGRSVKAVDAFFGLQVFQMCFVFITPAVFACSGYLGIQECASLFPELFGGFLTRVYGPIRVAELWTGLYLAILAIWIFMSFRAPKGKMSEGLCQFLCLYGFLYLVPVYTSIWYFIFFKHLGGVVGAIVIMNIALPFVISLAENVMSSLLYAAFFPWFAFTAMFFLVYTPQYSFARLWDTTWGNRATGKDSAINDSVENYMKRQNAYFSIFIVILNIGLTVCLAKLFAIGHTAVVIFMFVVFIPLFMQMIFSFLYMFILLPIRRLFLMKDKQPMGDKGADLGIDCEATVKDIDSTTFFMESAFPMEGSGQQYINRREPGVSFANMTADDAVTTSPQTVSNWLDFSPPGSPKNSELASLLPKTPSMEDRASKRMEVAGRFCKV